MHAERSASDSSQLDRLTQFVGPLLVELETGRERRLASEYVTCLVGPSERKTVEPMVRALHGVERAPTHERRMTEMLADGTWNHRSLTLLGAERLMRGFEFAAYTLDDTAVPKQGEHSVGVANQYAGCVGGLTNCQAVVTAGVASEHVSALIAAQLFLPASWCGPEAAERRRRCRVPAAIGHRTKPEIGIGIVRDVREWGLPRLPWLCDSGYGDNTAFRQALSCAGETYVVGVSLSLTMWPPSTTFSPQARSRGAGRPPVRLLADGEHRPITVSGVAVALPKEAWQTVLWRHGSRGPQRGRFAALRVRPARGIHGRNGHGTVRPEDLQDEQWLLIHWPEGESAPTKAWLSNLPADADIITLVSLARLRWRIERDHEETKGVLGFDHYEGRTWAGLHHHLALVIIAEQFLADERVREAREAAARAAFPPAAAHRPDATTTANHLRGRRRSARARCA
jgi:SRSO17 transposase